MRHPALRPSSLSALLFLAACSSTGAESGPPAPRIAEHGQRPLPELEEAIRAWDCSAERPLGLSELLDRLAGHDAVFVGETHLDDTTHRVEQAVLEGLLARRGGRVVLSLEMFERDEQAVLDRYLAGAIDEREFLASARPWGNYASDYRPLVEMAKAHGIPVVAANAPSALSRRVSSGGGAALAQLAPEERALFPAEILPAAAAYWERVDRATRGHMNFSSQPDEQRLYSVQNLWDNCMGDACAQALVRHPGATVVHVVGGFHVMYRDGTVAQFLRRAPDERVAVVEVLATPALHAARPERDSKRADYVVYAAELARSLSDGTHAVHVPGEVPYTLDVPATANEGARAPLLVWLPDSGERPEDARAFLLAAVGDEAALAVLAPPLPELADDLAPGGRWARAGSFRADQARVLHAIESLVEYVTRRFPVSGTRVVIGGNGHGATAVLWSAMNTEWLDAPFVALRPRGARALQLEGLPDLAPVTRSLRILVAREDEERARWIPADYAKIGTPAELDVLNGDAPVPHQVEDTLREALELGARERTDREPELCVLERDLPRARQWAEVYARRLEQGGRPARVVAAGELRGDEDPARMHRLAIGGVWPLATFVEGRGIPLAPGDFGGTTVVVLPAGIDAAEREAWLELERTKALKERSPFAGLRIAAAEGGPGLAQVLGELRASGARSVLVVPAVFCASPEEMEDMKRSLRETASVADELDLSWLPGLGGELCCAPAED